MADKVDVKESVLHILEDLKGGPGASGLINDVSSLFDNLPMDYVQDTLSVLLAFAIDNAEDKQAAYARVKEVIETLAHFGEPSFRETLRKIKERPH